MLVKELSNANRIDCNASIIVSSTTTATMKRKRDDSCISTSYHQDDDDDYILPLHKRYAPSSSNRLSAFGMSSYDIESRDGPATSFTSSSTNGNNDRSDNSNDDSVLDDETAALVSNFRTSILRGNHQTTASRLEAPHTISPSTTTSPYSLYNDCYVDDGADHNDYTKETTTTNSTYPDFPSIERGTTISDSSDVSSVESDPIDMILRPTSPQEDILLEGEHEDYYCSSSDYSPWSSTTELSSLEYTTDHRRKEEVVEKDAIEEARERSSSIDRSSSPSSSMVPSRRQPSPLWIMSSSYTPAVAQARGKQEEKTPFWPATAHWNGRMFPQGSSQVS